MPTPVAAERRRAVRPLATSLVTLGVVVAVSAALWGLVRTPADASRTVGEPASATRGMPVSRGGAAQAPSASASSPVTPSPEEPSGPSSADRAAGLRSTAIPQGASGTLVTVPGSAAAPGSGTRYRVRVQVEQGLDIDRTAFAEFVMATLNDPRSWGRDGRRTFARVDDTDASRPDITVALASPDTSAAKCRPLITRGKLSCARGGTSYLTLYRWVRGMADYDDDLTGYRRYLVNHEVGHVLGKGHVGCPGPGRPAPVMMQQTKGLAGCSPNPWPYP